MKLVVIIALLFSGMNATVPQTDPCDNLKVTAEVKHTTDGLDNGEVEVKVEGIEGSAFYFFHNNLGQPIPTEMDKYKLKELSANEYSCTVVTDSGCKKKIKFTID